jgi:hypothetical protein
MKKFLIILQLTLAIAFWLRLELSQLPFLFLIPYFLTGMFATLFVLARKQAVPFKQKVAIGAVAGYVLSLGFQPTFPQAFVIGVTSLGWLFGILLFAVYFYEVDGQQAVAPFTRFGARFRADDEQRKAATAADSAADPLTRLRTLFGGKSFGGGLYRIYSQADAAIATQRVEAAYPDVKGRIEVFAFDWLNRIYALDAGRQSDGQPQVMMFSLFSGEVLDAPVGLVAFHDHSLANSSDQLLDAPLFRKFLQLKGLKRIGWDQVVTMAQPLAEGGAFEVGNFELGNTQADWERYRLLSVPGAAKGG